MSTTYLSVSDVREAAQKWLWNLGEETKYATKLYKRGLDAQAACHGDAAVLCAKQAQALLELGKADVEISTGLITRRMQHTFRALDGFLEAAVKRQGESERLLKKR